jgi:hypothetical protein
MRELRREPRDPVKNICDITGPSATEFPMTASESLDSRLSRRTFGNEHDVKFDAEDAAHTTFVRLCRSHGDATVDELVLSRAAMHLHTFGVLSSIEAGNPGFVSDRYLNAITAETSISALELCVTGLWERVACGYRVSDADTLSVATQIHGQLHDLAARCLDNGGHITDPQQPEVCARCGSALDNLSQHNASQDRRDHARPDAA